MKDNSNDNDFDARDYEVGYGKPPKHTRFKKGQSGNPKGRPKGEKNFATIIDDVLGATIVITENGQQRTASKAEAMVMSLTAKAIKGNARAAQTIIKLADRYAPANTGPQVIYHLSDKPLTGEEWMKKYGNDAEPDAA